MTEWRAKQTDTVNEEASSKKLGSLFVLDYEIEEDQAYLEDVQSSHEALHLARLADAEDGEVDIDFGTRYIEGAVEDESFIFRPRQLLKKKRKQLLAGSLWKKRRIYSRKQLEILEQKYLCDTISNAGIATSITSLDGARGADLESLFQVTASSEVEQLLDLSLYIFLFALHQSSSSDSHCKFRLKLVKAQVDQGTFTAFFTRPNTQEATYICS